MFTEDEIWYGGGALGALPDTRVVPKKFEAPPAYGTKRNPLAAALSQGMADAERRRAQEGREEIRSGLSTLDKAKGVLEGTAMLGTAIPAAMIAPFAKEFTGTPEDEFTSKYMYMPRTEAGLLFAEERGEDIESLLNKMGESRLGQALGPVIEKVPGIYPISGATTRALDTGLSGIGKGTKLAAETAGQKGKQILDEGQDLLRSARTDFAAPPIGAVQLQAAQAPRSQLGMYSNAEQAALNLPQAKGTGNQFLAQLSKTAGVKPAELEWTGLSDFLKTKGEQPVTKAEIQDYLAANRVEIIEKQLAGPDAKYGPESNFQNLTLPGGSNYREVLLKLPNVGEKISFESWIDKYTAVRSMDELERDPRLMQLMRSQYESDVSKLPREGTFRGEHFNDPNIVSHMRVNDRTDADGNKVLFVEEMQSDWGQSGRDRGFKTNKKAELPEGTKVGMLPPGKESKFYVQLPEGVHGRNLFYGPTREQAIENAQNFIAQRSANPVPSAPFVSTQKYRVVKNGEELITKNKQGKDVRHIYDNPEDAKAAAKRFGGDVEDMGMQESTEDWINLSLKRLITDAVNNGYDKVAFINGKQSAERYKLSKQIDEISVVSRVHAGTGEQSRSVYLDTVDGESIRLGVANDGKIDNVNMQETKELIGKSLDEVIGKDLAKKIMEGGSQTIAGENLNIGGEGMKKFYDQIVPNTVNKLLKKLGGGKLDTVQLQDGMEQLGFTITPEMRELVKSQGLPMFAKGGAVTMKKGGVSSVMQGIDAAKQASKAGRRQERVDANLQRWSGSGEKPPVYYHATNAEEDFTVFDPTKSRSQAKAAFFTPEKQFASNWAYADKKALETAPEVKPRVMPSYLRVKKTFDFENPEHVQDVVSRAKLPKAFTPEYVAGRIGEGAWSFIEDREIQKAIKDAGFDSFFTKEQGAKNIGVFNPGDIKSIFNRGSYSEDPDISKAEGGAINGRARARAQAHKEAAMADGGQINGRARARAQAYKNGGAVELHLGIGGDALKRAKSGVGQALKAVKGAQKRQQPAPAAPPPKREFTGPLAPAQDPVRGQTSKELVQMQRKELNDEQKEALEIFKQRYPEFARASKFMTPQEIVKTIGRESNVMQIDQLLKAIPSAKELSSVAKLGDPKRGWYRASTQAIMDVFGPDAPRFASLLAAMSPQTSVESNLINTLNTWKNWTAAGRPTDAKAIRQIMGSSVQGTKGEESVLEAWAANASRVLSADDPLKVTLSGPKVDSFYRNLADDVYRVTNDAWMAGGLGVGQELFSGSPTAVQLMRGDPGLTPGYIGTSARVREAGQMANMLPSEAQETTWSVYMPLYEMQGQTGLRARDIIQRGLLTPDVIRGTPDFATLLKNPEYARVLEEAGYGQQLAGLRPTPFSTRGPSLSLSEQREVERAAERLEELREGRGRESRAKTISLPKQGQPESAFAYSTYETIPGRGVGHLEGLIEEDIGKRKHFSSRAAAPFRDLQGRDVLQGALGLKPLETRTMTGAYRPEGTVPGTPYRQSLETQPGFASGVEVPLTGGLQVPKRTQQQLTAAEALRGLMTAQRGSPWNVQIPTEKGGALMAFPERNARIDPEAMRYSASIMPEDIFMADTGQGVAVVPFGKPFSRQEGKLITERLGAKRFVPTKFAGDYVDYSQELTGPQGTGAATRKMFAALDPLTGKQKSALSQAAQKPAGELYELYEQTAKSRNEPTREDLMNFLRILRDKGLPGLTAALASGQALPAEEEARKAGGLAALR